MNNANDYIELAIDMLEESLIDEFEVIDAEIVTP